MEIRNMLGDPVHFGERKCRRMENVKFAITFKPFPALLIFGGPPRVVVDKEKQLIEKLELSERSIV